MSTHTGPKRFQPPRGANRRSARFADLAALLARAYLRLAERSRDRAVSCASAEQKVLDGCRPESPHVDGNEAA